LRFGLKAWVNLFDNQKFKCIINLIMARSEQQHPSSHEPSIIERAKRYADLLAIQAEAKKMREAANLRRGVEDIKFFADSGAEDVFIAKARELSQRFDDVILTKTVPRPESEYKLMGMAVTWDAEKDTDGNEISWKSVAGMTQRDLDDKKLIVIEGKRIRRIINKWNMDRVLSRAVRKAKTVSPLTDPKLGEERNGGEGRVIVDFKTPQD
jgi:hypothetical protein